MKNEGSLWFRARRDPTAREQLRKAYRTEFNSSLVLIALGIVVAIVDVMIDEAVSVWPIYMVCFGVFGAIFGWAQLARVGRIREQEQSCEQHARQVSSEAAPSASSDEPSA